MPKTKEVVGTGFDDILNGTSANEIFRGLAGNDLIFGSGGIDSIYGGDGDDFLDGGDGNDRVLGEGGNNEVHGGAGDDDVAGGSGNDLVFGDSGNDRVIGDTGNDQLFGGDGNDVLIGEFGADLLTGGAGADVFLYQFPFSSTTRTDWTAYNYPNLPIGVDTIEDFVTGLDKIDLSPLDANLETSVQRVNQKGGWANVGSEAFVLVGATDGTTPGHLTTTYDSATNMTTINGYMDSQLGADFTLNVVGQINPMIDIIL